MLSAMAHLDFKGWLYGLLAAIIGGGSSSVTAAFGASFLDPEKFNLTNPGAVLKLMAIVFGLNALLSMFLYLKQSPVPQIVDEVTTVTSTTEVRKSGAPEVKP